MPSPTRRTYGGAPGILPRLALSHMRLQLGQSTEAAGAAKEPAPTTSAGLGRARAVGSVNRKVTWALRAPPGTFTGSSVFVGALCV